MYEVKGDESFDSALEDEAAIEVEHLLAEPKSDHVSVDNVFCFDEENLEECLKVEDNSCIYESALKTNSGGMDSDTTHEGDDDLRFEVFDEMMPEVDEVENLHPTIGLSATCEDYLLDAECAEKVPGSDFTPIGTSSLENSSSESHSADFGGIDNGDVGISEMSTLSVPVPKCKNTTLDKASICRLHGTFRSKCGCQAQAKNSMKFHSSDSFDTNNHNENDMTYTSGLSIRGSSFPFTNVQYSNGPRGQGVKRKRFAGRNVSAKNSVEASKVGNLVTQKRLRKPTKRYIEEVSDLMSKNLKGKQKSSSSPKDKHPKVKSRTEHHQMGFRRLKVVSGSLPFNGAGIQMPSEFQASEECSKRHASTSGYDSEEEPYTDESEDDYETTVRSRKGDDRRKHQKMWTLSEVVKLVDGISKHGVGRWTEIKRLLFSSSAYRTPIDLRDKWRNLLRASNSWLQSGGEDEQKQKQASRPLPRAVLHRVSELASIYPYPRVRYSKHKQNGQVTAPLFTYKDTRVGRRTGRR